LAGYREGIWGKSRKNEGGALVWPQGGGSRAKSVSSEKGKGAGKEKNRNEKKPKKMYGTNGGGTTGYTPQVKGGEKRDPTSGNRKNEENKNEKEERALKKPREKTGAPERRAGEKPSMEEEGGQKQKFVVEDGTWSQMGGSA